MDLGDPHGGDFDIGTNRPRVLPPDLPTSLDDRRRTPLLNTETEIYDAWQGGMTSPREFYPHYDNSFSHPPPISPLSLPALPTPHLRLLRTLLM